MSFLSWADPSLVARARAAGGDVSAGLDLAGELGFVADELGHSTWNYLRTLASLGAGDLTVARAVEPHLDALAILHQAQPLTSFRPAPETRWGVYAAHTPGLQLTARPAREPADDQRWTLSGSKPWCSLAADLSHALVTAHLDDDTRAMFAVELTDRRISIDDTPWVARGLSAIRSTAVQFDDVEAIAVGPPNWYLERRGFAWGGIGVAAVWFGAAAALAESVLRAAQRRTPDQIALRHIGTLDLALHAAELSLRDAARRIDTDSGGEVADGEAWTLLAARVRDGAAAAVQVALHEAGLALGPGPLTSDEEHARRVADLTVYVRQHHGDRDLARTGALLLGGQA